VEGGGCLDLENLNGARTIGTITVELATISEQSQEKITDSRLYLLHLLPLFLERLHAVTSSVTGAAAGVPAKIARAIPRRIAQLLNPPKKVADGIRVPSDFDK
jgi:hypothetical protein